MEKASNKKGVVSQFMSVWARHDKVIGIAVLVVAIALPAIANQRYLTTILITCAINCILCLSLNLITGFMGITSLGHAAFYSIGAYTSAIFAKNLGLPFPLTFLLAIVLAALFGLLVGIPTLRVKGRYLAIVTLGFCEITRIVEYNWESLTNGPRGISGIPSFSLFGIKLSSQLQKYYICLVLVLLTIYVISKLMHSRLGRGISAIRDDEIAAEAMGINIFSYKVMAFMISSALAGLAGAFYAHHMAFIEPRVFSFDTSILILSMIILGGMGSIPGSIVGAVVLTAVPELLRGLAEYRLVIYGLVMVVMVIVNPSGLLGKYNFKHIRQRDEFERAQQKAQGGLVH